MIFVSPFLRNRVKYGKLGGKMGGPHISNISLLIGPEPFQKFGVGGGVQKAF